MKFVAFAQLVVPILIATFVEVTAAYRCYCDASDTLCDNCAYCSYQESVDIFGNSHTYQRCLPAGVVQAGNATVYYGDGCVTSVDTSNNRLSTYVCQGDYCNYQCGTSTTASPKQLMCYSCDGQADCMSNTVNCVYTANTVPGYCSYVRKQSSSGARSVHYTKSCNPKAQVTLDDGLVINDNGGTCQIVQDPTDPSVTYFVKICNWDYCNDYCDGIVPTTALPPTTHITTQTPVTKAASHLDYFTTIALPSIISVITVLKF